MTTFRKQAIDLVGRIVRGRMYCVKNKVGIVITKSAYANITAQYAAYHRKWTTQGITRFVLNYEQNLRLMAKPGEQAHELNQLIQKMKQQL